MNLDSVDLSFAPASDLSDDVANGCGSGSGCGDDLGCGSGEGYGCGEGRFDGKGSGVNPDAAGYDGLYGIGSGKGRLEIAVLAIIETIPTIMRHVIVSE